MSACTFVGKRERETETERETESACIRCKGARGGGVVSERP